jgi:FkbM family methyltransferase
MPKNNEQSLKMRAEKRDSCSIANELTANSDREKLLLPDMNSLSGPVLHTMFRRKRHIIGTFLRVLFRCRFTKLLDIISFSAATLKLLVGLWPRGLYYPAVLRDCVFSSSGKWYYCRAMSDDFLHAQANYEPEVRSAMLHTLNTGDVCVDVGANVGSFVLDAARKVGGSGLVVAIEPAPPTAKVLRMNIQMNGISNVTVLQKAAYSKSTVLTLNYLPIHTGAASLRKTSGAIHQFEVSAEPLDQMLRDIGDRPISVLKIDVEGVEKDVLSGGRATLQKTRRLIIEVHDSADTSELMRLARSAGHKCKEIAMGNMHYVICDKDAGNA